ncbi:MAG: hypothetical protein ISR34_11030 [Pirellulales bacterium]|nr:hypothetical protein [Pirellulales bacterium]
MVDRLHTARSKGASQSAQQHRALSQVAANSFALNQSEARVAGMTRATFDKESAVDEINRVHIINMKDIKSIKGKMSVRVRSAGLSAVHEDKEDDGRQARSSREVERRRGWRAARFEAAAMEG